ncbi:MAG: peptidase domain-containing ABC transporter [Candidatus Cyclobacteriaceae bacterium M2_1C_046]
MNDHFTITQRFWNLLKPDKTEIRNIYIYAIFNGLVYLSLPLGIQAIVNLIQGGRVSTSWIVLVALVVLGVSLMGVLQIFQLRITENLQQKIFTRAAFEFAYRIPKIRMEELYRHYAPELMNRFFDTITVQKGLSKILIEFSTATLQVIFGLILLSLYHPFFIAFSMLLVVVIYAIFRFTAKRGLATSLEESKYKYSLAHWLEELARSGITFKLAGKTDLPLQRADAHVGDYLQARENHFKVLIQQFSLMIFFKVLVIAGLLAIGGMLVMNQDMNIGQFVAAEIIIFMVINSVEKLIRSFEIIYDVLTALEKIGQVTDMELEKVDGRNLSETIDGGLEVEMQSVSFSYPGHQKKTLKNISLKIKKGERVVITGPNGAGKSTLLYIMAGLYDVQEGQITYNGLPKGNLDLCSLRSVIGDFLTQEQLFEGTVIENIAMGRENATFENIKWVVENLGLTDFINSLPRGYDSIIDPQGKKLPRSIIQKLLIARSIADKPKLLLLEDTFEHLEEQDRHEAIKFLTNKEHGWSILSISSDPDLLENMDTIAIMKNGRIEKIGSYNEMRNLLNFRRDKNA